jgi:hypothetical protein
MLCIETLVQHAVFISMDGKVRWADNVFHQALTCHTPDAVHALKTIPTKQHLFEQFKLQNNPITLGANMIHK